MLSNGQELNATLDRIARFQQVAHLRRVETNPANYKGASSGFPAEIDRTQIDALEYLILFPAEITR